MIHDISDVLYDLAPDLRETAKLSTSRVMICCPFHEETGPSCSVSRDTPVFCCFGCGESGHVSRLLRQLGLNNSGVKIALESAGFRDDPEARERSRLLKQRGKVGAKVMLTGVDPYRAEYLLDEDVLDVYRQAPTTLLKAGFTKKTLRHFEVGFDYPYCRITFPLRTHYGELVGISGRDDSGEDRGPRYKIYDRELTSRTDIQIPAGYTMDGVKETIFWHGHVVFPLLMQADQDTVILVEGFKQAMAVYQAGYKTVLALIGSALTEYHTELLSRYAQRIILFLDNNEAGIRATHVSVPRLQWRGLQPSIASYPDDRGQPDELTKNEIVDAIKSRTSYQDWEKEHVDHQAPQRLSPLLAPRAGRG